MQDFDHQPYEAPIVHAKLCSEDAAAKGARATIPSQRTKSLQTVAEPTATKIDIAHQYYDDLYTRS